MSPRKTVHADPDEHRTAPSTVFRWQKTVRHDPLPAVDSERIVRLFSAHPGRISIATDLGATREKHPPDACGSLRLLLRDATHASHMRLETTTLMRAIAGGAPAICDVRDYLSRQLNLHAPMEASLSRWMPSEWADVRLQKAEWLRRDLRALGPLPLDAPVSIPEVRSRSGALGMSYVLEGGTIGLQIVRKRLMKRHVALGKAGRFFLGYGSDTGKQWQSFVAALDAVARPEWPEAISVAQATFDAFHQSFSAVDVTSS